MFALIKGKFSGVKKELRENISSIKQTVTEISNNLVQKGKTTYSSMVENLMKYFLYLINETSQTLFNLQINQRNIIENTYQEKIQIEERTKKIKRYTGLMKNLEKEISDLSDLNSNWAKSMQEKFKHLSNELQEQDLQNFVLFESYKIINKQKRIVLNSTSKTNK